MRTPRINTIVLLSLVLLGACRSNVFTPVDKPDPAEAAASYLDQHKPDEAISVLTDAMKDEPNNYQLISLMASAKAQKAGVDTFDIAVKLATEGVSGDNGLTAMFGLLPAATAANRQLMLEAVTLLNSIPEAERKDADNFKSTLYNASFTALQAKFFDADGDGKFTAEELENLDDASAEAILNSLNDAAGSAAIVQGAEANGVAADKVKQIQSAIDQEPGATVSEKLKNYLAASGQSLPGQ